MSNEEKSVLYDLYSYVATITLNDPKNGNAVNNDNLSLMYDFLQQAINNDECRIIVIEGKEGIFCRGMDFGNLIKNSNIHNEIKAEFSEPYKKVVKTIRDSPKPVIAKVDGDVLAGGMGIALACDIIIASKNSVFGLSEVLFGIIPAYVFPFLSERISYKKARYLILSSKRFDAEYAYQIGMIDEIAEENKLNKAVKDTIKRLLFSSPDALALTKEYSDRLNEINIDRELDIAQKQLTDLLNVSENIETIRAFLEGEKPSWVVSYKSKKN